MQGRPLFPLRERRPFLLGDTPVAYYGTIAYAPWAQAALPHWLYRLSPLRRFAIENDKTRGRAVQHPDYM